MLPMSLFWFDPYPDQLTTIMTLTVDYFLRLFQEQGALVAQSNDILTAIIHGMKSNETSNHVRLAATNALLNSLEFTRGNFEQEVRITYWMKRFSKNV